MASPLLPPDLVAMMARGVSIMVGSRDAALRPSIMRAIGSRVDDGGRAITVFVSRRQSRQLLEDITATGHIAVVFSEPTTHRTVQVKAASARMRAATPEDAPVLAACVDSFVHELDSIGYGTALPRAMLAHRLDDLVAIEFTPEQAHDQTPGPRAGTAIGGAG